MIYLVLIILAVLSVIGFLIKAERTVLPKLFKFLSWIVIIGFTCFYIVIFTEIGTSDIIGTYTYFLTDGQFIPLFIGEFIILLVFNLISVKNKVKAVILSISQLALTMLSYLVFMIAVGILIIVFMTGKGDKVKNVVNRKSYTEEEDIYAKANGFYDAETANASGFSTKEANQPGFDFTKKREY